MGPGRQQAPEKLHVIRLKEVSTNAENVAIPTRRIQDLKESQGNYVRNLWASTAVPVGGGGAWPGYSQQRKHRRCGGRRRDRRPGCGARGRWRGLAGLRDDAPSEARGADGERAGRRPRAHQAARPHSRIRRRPEHQRGHKHRHNKAGRNPSVPARPDAQR